MGRPCIEAEALRKVIRHRAVVDDLTFEVHPGEVVGFLGPNGAGKTTTIRMLLGLVHPTAGNARLAGHPVPGPGMSEIGSLVDQPALYPWMSARDNLRVLAAARETRERDEALHMVGLGQVGRKRVSSFSRGMRQRLAVACAFLNAKSGVILDEPADGLDPAGIKELRDLIRHLADSGLGVLFSSHQLADIERSCDRLVLISNGRMLQTGTLSDFTGSQTWLEVVVAGSVSDQAYELLNQRFKLIGTPSEHCFAVLANSGREVSEILASKGIFVESIVEKRQTLEERFLSLTEGEAVR